MTSALLASEWFLVPVKPEPLSALGIDLLRGVIQRCSENYAHRIECAGVVLTIAEENTVAFRDARQALQQNRLWKGRLFETVLPKRTEVAREQKHQKLMLELSDNACKRGITRLARELLNRVGQNDNASQPA